MLPQVLLRLRHERLELGHAEAAFRLLRGLLHVLSLVEVDLRVAAVHTLPVSRAAFGLPGLRPRHQMLDPVLHLCL